MDNKKAPREEELIKAIKFPIREKVRTTKFPMATADRLGHPDDFMTLIRLQSFTPPTEIVFRAGDIVRAEDIGEGVVIGFSSLSNNPDVFFYEEQKIICVRIQTLTRV